MARTWLSIRVELVSGHGADLWPRPGRVFAAARSHSFARLASAIDLAFARWDLAHLHLFTLSDAARVSPLDWWDGEAPDGTVDGHVTKLSRLEAGEQFAYVFDMGDAWAHLCTVAEKRIDPLEELGEVPDRPVPYWGWGSLPVQYARRWDGDDGESPMPKRPARGLSDLPPILPWWGEHRRGCLHVAYTKWPSVGNRSDREWENQLAAGTSLSPFGAAARAALIAQAAAPGSCAATCATTAAWPAA